MPATPMGAAPLAEAGEVEGRCSDWATPPSGHGCDSRAGPLQPDNSAQKRPLEISWTRTPGTLAPDVPPAER
jgi:hypothetical protein